MPPAGLGYGPVCCAGLCYDIGSCPVATAVGERRRLAVAVRTEKPQVAQSIVEKVSIDVVNVQGQWSSVP